MKKLDLMAEMAEVIQTHPAWDASDEAHYAWWDKAWDILKKWKGWK